MRVGILVLVLALASGAVGADEGVPVRRHVIALLEGSGPDPHTEDVVHQLLELPLNHFGMVVHRHYIDNGPPPALWLEDAGVLLTYFTASDKSCPWLWAWLEKEIAPRGMRVLHFGEFGPLALPDAGHLTRWLARFGLDYDDAFFQGPFGVKVEFWRERACAYEADPRVRAVHRGPRNTSPRNKVWVKTRRTHHEKDVRAPVVTGPWGALALDPWTLREGSELQDRRWHLDPFLFIEEAVGAARTPAPHPSVLNGRRMWFLQVDGDGFESLSTVQPGQYSAKVMHEDVFLRYRLPYTVSIIVRSLTKDYEVKEPTRAMLLARRILNLPFVEPASHGVLHTLRWQQDWKPGYPPRTIMWYGRLKNYEYSQTNEVKESIRFINERLLDEGRRCAVMLWTGEANPLEDAILAAREAGAWNVNGGVFRWDRWHDSVGFVSPWSREVGRALQVYAGAANENDFDGFFTTMPGSFQHIDETIERTGTPRILKPANLYIHFYSAENPARLRTIHKLVRRWGLEEETAPVFASVYAHAVTSAVNGARIYRIGNGWRFEDFRGCRTVRIDREPRGVDWRKSRGLLGARRVGRSLYLHLARPDAEVWLTKSAAAAPHVEQANCLLEDAKLSPKGAAVTATAHNFRIVVFAGFPPRRKVTVTEDGEAWSCRADEKGRVTVRLAEHGSTRIVARVR